MSWPRQSRKAWSMTEGTLQVGGNKFNYSINGAEAAGFPYENVNYTAN